MGELKIGLLFMFVFLCIGIAINRNFEIKEHQAIIEQLSGLQIQLGDTMMMIDALDNKIN